VYLADILNNVGIEAEAQYQDTDWSIVIKGKKYFTQTTFTDNPEMALLLSVQYFADVLNSGNDYETWYSYKNKEHFLNLRLKDVQESQPEPTGLERIIPLRDL